MKTSKELYTGLEDMSVKGGSDIGVVAAEALQAFAVEIGINDPKFITKIENYAEKIKTLKPTMAMVHNAMTDMLHIFKENASNLDAGIAAINQYVTKSKGESEKSLEKVADIFSEVVQDGDVLFTHSFTKSSLLSLEKAKRKGKHFSVISGESRPLKEGAYFATRLAQLGIEDTVVTDAATAFYMPKCTRVVVGADTLYTDGTVVNKMGTLGLAILANQFKKPVYVLTITAKLYVPSLQGFRLKLENRPATEVMNMTDHKKVEEHLKAENFFFEETPAEYISYLVTEKGLIKPSQLLELVSKKEW